MRRILPIETRAHVVARIVVVVVVVAAVTIAVMSMVQVGMIQKKLDGGNLGPANVVGDDLELAKLRRRDVHIGYRERQSLTIPMMMNAHDVPR